MGTAWDKRNILTWILHLSKRYNDLHASKGSSSVPGNKSFDKTFKIVAELLETSIKLSNRQKFRDSRETKFKNGFSRCTQCRGNEAWTIRTQTKRSVIASEMRFIRKTGSYWLSLITGAAVTIRLGIFLVSEYINAKRQNWHIVSTGWIFSECLNTCYVNRRPQQATEPNTRKLLMMNHHMSFRYLGFLP